VIDAGFQARTRLKPATRGEAFKVERVAVSAFEHAAADPGDHRRVVAAQLHRREQGPEVGPAWQGWPSGRCWPPPPAGYDGCQAGVIDGPQQARDEHVHRGFLEGGGKVFVAALHRGVPELVELPYRGGLDAGVRYIVAVFALVQVGTGKRQALASPLRASLSMAAPPG
jgi:hypothetical protein